MGWIELKTLLRQSFGGLTSGEGGIRTRGTV